MTALIIKAKLDRQVAELLGKKTSEVAAITATFLYETARALMEQGHVRLDGLGELHVRINGGVLHRTTFRGKKAVLIIPKKYYVDFRKSWKLTAAFREHFQGRSP